MLKLYWQFSYYFGSNFYIWEKKGENDLRVREVVCKNLPACNQPCFNPWHRQKAHGVLVEMISSEPGVTSKYQMIWPKNILKER